MFNLANKLTLLRMLLVPLVIVLLSAALSAAAAALLRTAKTRLCGEVRV